MSFNRTPNWHSATVVESTVIADRIRRIVLAVERPRPVRAGEHLDLLIEVDGVETVRSYSIVDASPRGERVALSVLHTRSSRGGSTRMHQLRAGDSLRVTHPIQAFPLRIGAPRYTLLAGGIGITAMAGMAATLQRVHANYELVYVGRSRGAMAYLSELKEQHGDRFRAHIDDEAGSFDVEAIVAGIKPGEELYMCGPIRLMDAVRRSWMRQDKDLTALRYETFGSSGWFEPEPFDIVIPRLGIECTVAVDESPLEALERVGADMMFDCRKGECGVCTVRVLQHEGVVDHRDVFFSDAQKQATEQMCCCVSRIAHHGALAADEPRNAPTEVEKGEARPRLVIDIT